MWTKGTFPLCAASVTVWGEPFTVSEPFTVRAAIQTRLKWQERLQWNPTRWLLKVCGSHILCVSVHDFEASFEKHSNLLRGTVVSDTSCGTSNGIQQPDRYAINHAIHERATFSQRRQKSKPKGRDFSTSCTLCGTFNLPHACSVKNPIVFP